MNLTFLQNEAFKYMKSGNNVFLTGQAGTGKTYLLNIFIDWYKNNNNENKKKQELFITSTTGLSALLINGITINRFAGIGLADKDLDYYLSRIIKIPKTKSRWIMTKVLIIDEISMMNPDTFDLLNNLAKRIRKSDAPFGGIQLILSGDFCQLPPVKSNDFCFESFSWDECITKTFYFNVILRQNDNIFQKVLNNIRIGKCDEEDKNILLERLNKYNNNEFKNDYGIIPTMLFPIKKMVQEYNKKELDLLLDKKIKNNIYNSKYHFGVKVKEENKSILIDLINSSYFIEDELIFAIGSQVMLIINLPHHNLANGSRGIIIGFSKDKNFPIVQFLNGKELEIEEHCWSLDENGNSVVKLQIPLIYAWAITIHKSQGMTLDYVVTDVGDDIFEYGQIYVVLSRVKSLDGLFLKNINFDKIKSHPKILKYYNSLL
jgi:ATP-dependent DNA helicase PIF1